MLQGLMAGMDLCLLAYTLVHWWLLRGVRVGLHAVTLLGTTDFLAALSGVGPQNQPERGRVHLGRRHGGRAHGGRVCARVGGLQHGTGHWHGAGAAAAGSGAGRSASRAAASSPGSATSVSGATMTVRVGSVDATTAGL